MGYSANGFGSFQIRKNAKIAELEAVLDEEDIKNCFNEFCGVVLVKGVSFVEVSCYQNYYEDEVLDALYKLAPFVENGSEMRFSGEDGEHWRFVLKDDSWEQEDGYIVYVGWETPPDAFTVIRDDCKIALTDDELKAAGEFWLKKTGKAVAGNE